MSITETIKSLKMCCITIDSQLRFDEHISNLCNKASMQLNAINSHQRYMDSQEMKAIVNSFIYENFNYCALFGHQADPHVKLSKLKNVV